jgi:hypothetical protein
MAFGQSFDRRQVEAQGFADILLWSYENSHKHRYPGFRRNALP